MSNNPYAGRVPLHLRKVDEQDRLEKSTSYRSEHSHGLMYRSPDQEPKLKRENGCTPLRRYPNGQLDHEYVAHKVIDVVHKLQNAGYVTEFEKALLSIILPGQFQLVDPQIAKTMARLSDNEKLLVATFVMRHFGAEQNWNSGLGGGSVPFRKVTRS